MKHGSGRLRLQNHCIDWIFGRRGVGQARDPEPGDIRDPGLDKAVAAVRKTDLDKAIDIMKSAGLWDEKQPH